MTQHTAEEFDQALASFIAGAQRISDDYMERSFPTLEKATYTAERGRVRVRIVRGDGSSRSACGFVDLATGDVLYAAGWSGPAKSPVRGNIFDAKNGLGWVGEYGVRTLR